MTGSSVVVGKNSMTMKYRVKLGRIQLLDSRFPCGQPHLPLRQYKVHVNLHIFDFRPVKLPTWTRLVKPELK